MELAESKFKNLDFSKAVVKAGMKNAGSSHPQLELQTTFNKMVINEVGRMVTGLKPGSHVTFLDMRDHASSMQDRFFICESWQVATDKNGDPVYNGAKLGANSAFNFNVIYGLILNGDYELVTINQADLIEKGKLVKTGDRVTSAQKVYCKLEVVSDEELLVGTDINEEEVYRKVYRLSSFEYVDRDLDDLTDDNPFPEEQE